MLKINRKIFFLILVAISCIWLIICYSYSSDGKDKENETINLAYVACNKKDIISEALTSLKSILMFTNSHLKFYIFTESSNARLFIEQFNKWPSHIQSKFEYEFIEPGFPVQYEKMWKNHYGPCIMQRILFPDILKSVHRLIYVDADTIFLTDIKQLWDEFSLFNASQLVAAALDGTDPKHSFYPTQAKVPYYGKTGINTGVMLYDLTKMREFNFVQKMVTFFLKYHKDLILPDQCLHNILFHYNPDRLYLLSCSWNVKYLTCVGELICEDFKTLGAKLLHGILSSFHKNEDHLLKFIYQIFEKHKLEHSSSSVYSELKNLILDKNLKYFSVCFPYAEMLIKNMK